MNTLLLFLCITCIGLQLYLSITVTNQKYQIKCLDFSILNIKLQLSTYQDKRLKDEEEIQKIKSQSLINLAQSNELLENISNISKLSQQSSKSKNDATTNQ